MTHYPLTHFHLCARWVVALNGNFHCSGGSELEIKRRAAFVHESMFTLDQNIILAFLYIAGNQVLAV